MDELTNENTNDEDDELLMPVNSADEILDSVNSKEAKEFIMR